MYRKTKIIATLGPSTDDAETIRRLITSGMNVARFNFSHSKFEDHERRLGLVRDIAAELDVAVAAMQDIQGPKIRVGEFPGGHITLVDGATVELHPGDGDGNEQHIYIAYLDQVEVEPDGKILLCDGMVTLRVDDASPDRVTATVIEGGVVHDHKGAAFPGADSTIPVVTEKDREALEFGNALGFDLVAASFVNSSRDVALVEQQCAGRPIIAKIETATGYLNLAEILEVAEGAMVARGDLGVELSIESVPRAQAEILHRTNAAGKISITATEMLESMIHSPRPTRAEVTDVYQSVLDGTDCVMLSAETAVGEYPAKSVQVMSQICVEAERSEEWRRDSDVSNLSSGAQFASATAEASVDTADRLQLSTIVAFTETGSTARLLSKYRPHADILAFTPRVETYRRMAAYGGVKPMMIDRVHSTDEMIAAAERRMLDDGLVEYGDGVVMVAGVPPNERSSTNLMKLHQIGSGDVLSPVPRI